MRTAQEFVCLQRHERGHGRPGKCIERQDSDERSGPRSGEGRYINAGECNTDWDVLALPVGTIIWAIAWKPWDRIVTNVRFKKDVIVPLGTAQWKDAIASRPRRLAARSPAVTPWCVCDGQRCPDADYVSLFRPTAINSSDTQGYRDRVQTCVAGTSPSRWRIVPTRRL